MRFHLVDRITQVKAATSITTIKNLTRAEEYLAEHFPAFPVLPGVLMIEAVTQAAGWLVRLTEDFARPMVLLREVKAVRFGQFLAPGRCLEIHCEWAGEQEGRVTVKAKGTVDGQSSLAARVVVEGFRLADQDANRAAEDERMRQRQREWYRRLVATECPVGYRGTVHAIDG
jgi:3-hydroxyacyl-[acyl-carrier-protein] dehydratase